MHFYLLIEENLIILCGSESYINHAHVNFVQRKSAINVRKIKDEYFSTRLEIILFISGDEMSQTHSVSLQYAAVNAEVN